MIPSLEKKSAIAFSLISFDDCVFRLMRGVAGWGTRRDDAYHKSGRE